jgi:hypothetical protein
MPATGRDKTMSCSPTSNTEACHARRATKERARLGKFLRAIANDIAAIKANVGKQVNSDAIAKFDLNANDSITQTMCRQRRRARGW